MIVVLCHFLSHVSFLCHISLSFLCRISLSHFSVSFFCLVFLSHSSLISLSHFSVSFFCLSSLFHFSVSSLSPTSMPPASHIYALSSLHLYLFSAKGACCLSMLADTASGFHMSAWSGKSSRPCPWVSFGEVGGREGMGVGRVLGVL